MLALLLAAATASNLAPAVVGGLEGCWTAPGRVRGKDATSFARGEWHLGDAVYHNSFVREAKGWRWTILERPAAGGRERTFAEYRLSPATCRNKDFAF